MTGQLVMPATVPGSYTVLDWTVQGWVRVTGHRVWPDGARFLVVRDWPGDWLLCWREGIAPEMAGTGTLLEESQVERII